jgi:hypothetical protein
MAKNIKKEIKKHKQISLVNKDFNSLRNELQRYARTHFSENIVDFSDASLGGLILDIGAYVGDVMTYYIDHQFNENSIENAIEISNIERLVREAGIKIPSASPAYAQVDISIVVPSQLVNGVYVPKTNALPIVKKNSIFSTSNNIEFVLLQDVDFRKQNSAGQLVATIRAGSISGGIPTNFILTLSSDVSSAKINTERFEIPDTRTSFRTITLAKDNVNEIISVYESCGDEYFEVDTLSQDTVFKVRENTRNDNEVANSRIEMLHAPKRFIATRSINTGKTTLRFGAGSEEEFDEDIIPDPSEHAIRLFGDRSSIPTVSIDPNSFLTTQTLGISPRNTTLTINYRSGGGLNHNVAAGAISSVKTLITEFATATTAIDESRVRASLTVINRKSAKGGEEEPTIEELRNIAIFNRSAQNRIVTREDLIARVYSLPSNFGRVFRVGVSDNPNNPRGALLYIISRDANRKLTISSDTLKQNLAKYLNQFRLVSDGIDILDAKIINIGLNYTVTVEKGYRQEIVLTNINERLKKYFQIEKMHINKPIIIGEIENIILNSPGVVSVLSLTPVNKRGNDTRTSNAYSSEDYNPLSYIDRGYLFPPEGGIFEVKFPQDDITGRVL